MELLYLFSSLGDQILLVNGQSVNLSNVDELLIKLSEKVRLLEYVRLSTCMYMCCNYGGYITVHVHVHVHVHVRQTCCN